MAMLEFSFFGTFRVARAGAPIDTLRYDKVRGLLAWLVVESNRAHRRERLAALFWPDLPMPRARQNLSQALYILRKALDPAAAKPSWLAITGRTVQFVPDACCAVDVLRFAKFTSTGVLADWEHAAALYRGCLLEGLAIGDSAEFEEWLLLQREHYARMAAGLFARLAQHCAASGEYDAALGWAQRWLAIDPWQEEAHRTVMSVLAAAGRRSDALAHYATCRQLLLDELGVEPSAATVELSAAISRDRSAAFAPPPPPTPLIGRAHDITAIEHLLADPECRLLNLVGPGGIGKTHLAQVAAQRCAHQFAHGAVFVPLAVVATGEGLAPAIALALNVPLSGAAPAEHQLHTYLSHRSLLLILDNMEHLHSALPLVLEFLRQAPAVKVLATSRARFDVTREHVYSVAGLPVAGDSSADDESAVQLFLYHARRVAPAMTVSADDLGLVRQICTAVGGIPLAIMLAASWVPFLPLRTIAGYLTCQVGADGQTLGLDLLTSDWVDLPQRQRSMRSVLGHSWSLLSAREQHIFSMLAIFRDGFTAAAAAALADATIFDLRSLASKSLVTHGAGDRFAMHPLLQQFAWSQLARSPGLLGAAQNKHRAYFAAQVRHWVAALDGADQLQSIRCLETDLGNVRAARHAAANQHEYDEACELLEGLCRLFVWRGRYQEGETLCRQALGDRPEDAPTGQRVRLLTWHGLFLRNLGETRGALRRFEAALALAQPRSPDAADLYLPDAQAFALLEYARALLDVDRVRSRAAAEECLALYRSMASASGEAQARCILAGLDFKVSDYQSSGEQAAQSLAIALRLHDRRVEATALEMLAMVRVAQGNLADSEDLIRRSVALFQSLGDEPNAIDALHMLAAQMIYSGEFATGKRLLVEAAEAARQNGAIGQYASLAETLGWALINLGEYSDARPHIELVRGVMADTGDPRGLALADLALAEIDLADGRYAAADARLARSAAAFLAMQQHDEYVIATAERVLALRGLGKTTAACALLTEITPQAASIAAFAPAQFVIAAHVLLLIDAGDVEAALELYATVAEHPYFARSRYRFDTVGKWVAEVERTRSATQCAAIQVCGRQRDPVAALRHAEAIMSAGNGQPLLQA